MGGSSNSAAVECIGWIWELRNNVLYFISGKNSYGKRAVQKHEVFNVIRHVHDVLTCRSEEQKCMLQSTKSISN